VAKAYTMGSSAALTRTSVSHDPTLGGGGLASPLRRDSGFKEKPEDLLRALHVERHE
jgi:hypothetical protein